MAKAKKAEARSVEAENKMYELMLILKPDLLESAITKKLKEISKFLEDGGAKIIMEDVWDKRKLAYNIKQYSEGIYVVYNFEGLTSAMRELDEHLRIDNDVIRHLLTTLKEGYQYSKFDDETEEEEKPRKSTPKPAPKRVEKKEEAVKKPEPVIEEEEVEEIVEKVTEEPTEEVAEEKVEEPIEVIKVDKIDLDDKLNKLLEGDDLNI